MGEKMERTRNTSPDLINALPDSLFLHILSLLDMGEVMKTSLLSKRWRYLWKSIPCLCFEEGGQFAGAQMTNFIDRCLFHHEGSKIHNLRIVLNAFNYTHASLVDSWIRYAIKCEVEDLEFEFCGRYRFYQLRHRLPCSLYKCTTLTSLSLCQCNLNLPDSFLLGSLKKLSLQRLELSSDSIERLSSSCPLLEEIYLIACNKGIDLMNIVITNEHVKRLEISNYGGYGSETVKINAPTLLSLKIYHCHPTVRFHVEQLGSLMSVDVVCDSVIVDCFNNDTRKENIKRVEKLLNDLRHVKHLKLCGLCVQILSLRMLQSSDIYPISATCLELNTSLKRWVLPGISYLLESCSNLQKLKIVNDNCYDGIPAYWRFDVELIDGHDIEEEQEEYCESFETNVTSIMQNIKTIEIDFQGKSCHEEFIRFLLKNAKVLDRMVINTPKKYANNFELLFRLSQRTNGFPRSSPSAKLFIT